ncbi:hypothetical protein ON010_g18395 [Phytophthora cinnamomi]|nr:hypothetical protein ON010_g18395 [Phytophthora cinnamomi]
MVWLGLRPGRIPLRLWAKPRPGVIDCDHPGSEMRVQGLSPALAVNMESELRSRSLSPAFAVIVESELRVPIRAGRMGSELRVQILGPAFAVAKESPPSLWSLSRESEIWAPSKVWASWPRGIREKST